MYYGVRVCAYSFSFDTWVMPLEQSPLAMVDADVEAAAHFDHWLRAHLDEENVRQDLWPEALHNARVIPAVEYIQVRTPIHVPVVCSYVAVPCTLSVTSLDLFCQLWCLTAFGLGLGKETGREAVCGRTSLNSKCLVFGRGQLCAGRHFVASYASSCVVYGSVSKSRQALSSSLIGVTILLPHHTIVSSVIITTSCIILLH